MPASIRQRDDAETTKRRTRYQLRSKSPTPNNRHLDDNGIIEKENLNKQQQQRQKDGMELRKSRSRSRQRIRNNNPALQDNTNIKRSSSLCSTNKNRNNSRRSRSMERKRSNSQPSRRKKKIDNSRDEDPCDDTDESTEDEEDNRDPLTVLFQDHGEKTRKVKFNELYDEESISVNSIVLNNDTKQWSFKKLFSKKFISRKTKLFGDGIDSAMVEDKSDEKPPDSVLGMLDSTSWNKQDPMLDDPSDILTQRPSNFRIGFGIDQRVNELINAGDLNYQTQNFDRAISSYMNAMDLMKSKNISSQHDVCLYVLKRLNDTHHVISSLKNTETILTMGLNRENDDEYIKALKLYTIAYRTRRGALGEDHMFLAVILYMLARVQAKRGEFTEALLIYKLSLEITSRGVRSPLPRVCEEGSHLFDPPSLSCVYRDIGAVHEQMGNLSKALCLYQESLRLYANSDLNPVSNIVGVLDRVKIDPTGQPGNDEAMEMFLEMALYNLPVDKGNVDLAVTLHNIGQVHRRLGQFNLALQAYKSALRGIKAAMGKNHPNVAAMLGNIGNLHKEIGDNDKAYDIYQQVVALESTVLGPHHPELAVTLHNIGTIEYCRGNFETAEMVFQRVLQIQMTTFGKNHAVVAITLNSVGEVYERMNRIEKAIDVYETSLRICMINLGRHHPDVGRLWHKIAGIYFGTLGDLKMAEKYCIKSLKVYKINRFTDDNALVTESFRQLADIRAAIAMSKIIR